MINNSLHIDNEYSHQNRIVLFENDKIYLKSLDKAKIDLNELLMKRIPSGVFKLIISSPPYNIGKKYEKNLHWKYIWNGRNKF